MKLLLHACCAPCSLEPWRLLEQEGHEMAIVYVNPNIQPRVEHDQRLHELEGWCADNNIEFIYPGYDEEAWERRVAPLGTDRMARCRACYRLRLEIAGDIGEERGFEGLATTLAVSPYQLQDVCSQELIKVAEKHDLIPLVRDFTPYYAQATKRSRDLGMYRQKYCGCRFSAAEAAMERCESRDARRESKDIKRIIKRAGALE